MIQRSPEMVFWLVNVHIFLYNRAQIDAPYRLEAHCARKYRCKYKSRLVNRYIFISGPVLYRHTAAPVISKASDSNISVHPKSANWGKLTTDLTKPSKNARQNREEGVSPEGGCSEGLDAFRFFFKTTSNGLRPQAGGPVRSVVAGHSWLRPRGGIQVDSSLWPSNGLATDVCVFLGLSFLHISKLLASFGKYFILPRFFAQCFCPYVSIWNFYLHRRFGKNLKCFWRRIRHD